MNISHRPPKLDVAGSNALDLFFIPCGAKLLYYNHLISLNDFSLALDEFASDFPFPFYFYFGANIFVSENLYGFL